MQTVAGVTSPEELYHSIIEGYKVSVLYTMYCQCETYYTVYAQHGTIG